MAWKVSTLAQWTKLNENSSTSWNRKLRHSPLLQPGEDLLSPFIPGSELNLRSIHWVPQLQVLPSDRTIYNVNAGENLDLFKALKVWPRILPRLFINFLDFKGGHNFGTRIVTHFILQIYKGDKRPIRISTIPISPKLIPNTVTSLNIQLGILLNLGNPHLISSQSLLYFRKDCSAL